MSNNDIGDAISISFPKARSAVIDGTGIELRAYLNGAGKERVIWSLGDHRGQRARVDLAEAYLLLPQGRKIHFNGDLTTRITLPRFVSDALAQDFDELAAGLNLYLADEFDMSIDDPRSADANMPEPVIEMENTELWDCIQELRGADGGEAGEDNLPATSDDDSDWG